MKQRHFHSFLALLLILVTTEFLWYEQVSDIKSPVEQTETDTEEKSNLKEETETHRKSEISLLDGSNDFMLVESMNFAFRRTLSNGFLKLITCQSRFRTNLYLLYQQLKLDL